MSKVKSERNRMQSLLLTAETFSAPWRERLPNGQLSDEYGPASPVAHARALAKFKLWSYQPTRFGAKPIFDGDVAFVITTYLAENEVPKREREVFEYLAEGHSIRWCARKLGVRRETVRSYLKRLRVRVER